MSRRAMPFHGPSFAIAIAVAIAFAVVVAAAAMPLHALAASEGRRLLRPRQAGHLRGPAAVEAPGVMATTCTPRRTSRLQFTRFFESEFLELRFVSINSFAILRIEGCPKQHPPNVVLGCPCKRTGGRTGSVMQTNLGATARWVLLSILACLPCRSTRLRSEKTVANRSWARKRNDFVPAKA